MFPQGTLKIFYPFYKMSRGIMTIKIFCLID